MTMKITKNQQKNQHQGASDTLGATVFIDTEALLSLRPFKTLKPTNSITSLKSV